MFVSDRAISARPVNCAAVRAEAIRTFWVLEPFQCVLLDAAEGYALHVAIRGEAFLVESVSSVTEAKARAKALFAVFVPTAGDTPELVAKPRVAPNRR